MKCVLSANDLKSFNSYEVPMDEPPEHFAEFRHSYTVDAIPEDDDKQNDLNRRLQKHPDETGVSPVRNPLSVPKQTDPTSDRRQS
jgi:hypothetical protein